MNQMLITGSNRGLKPELARLYGNDSFRIYGADHARLSAC